MLKYLSLFSGIGGFEVGIQKSDIPMECILYSEIDKYASSIYSRHFPRHRNLGDVREIETESLPGFDFLVGGFPCQSFSHAGKRRGFDDTRGTLFFEIARILKDKRPKYFLLENVRGLLHHDKGKTFKRILEVLASLGYYVQWEIFNSKKFVPQNRERIFIKGYLGEECGGEVLSFRGADKTVDGGLDNRRISNTYYNGRTGRIHKPDELMNTLTCSGHNSAGSQLIQLNNDKKRNMGDKVYDNGQGGKTGLYRVDEHFTRVNDKQLTTTTKNGDCFALTTRNRGMSFHKKQDNYVLEEESLKIRETTKKGYKEAYPSDGVLLNRGNRKIAKGIVRKDHCGALQTAGVWGTVDPNYRIRRLTPIECERLQGFEDDWTKYGKNGELISDTQRYKCIGNAVTVPLISFIINEMFGGMANED